MRQLREALKTIQLTSNQISYIIIGELISLLQETVAHLLFIFKGGRFNERATTN